MGLQLRGRARSSVGSAARARLGSARPRCGRSRRLSVRTWRCRAVRRRLRRSCRSRGMWICWTGLGRVPAGLPAPQQNALQVALALKDAAGSLPEQRAGPVWRCRPQAPQQNSNLRYASGEPARWACDLAKRLHGQGPGCIWGQVTGPVVQASTGRAVGTSRPAVIQCRLPSSWPSYLPGLHLVPGRFPGAVAPRERSLPRPGPARP